MKRIVAVTLVYLKTGEKATPNKVLKLQHKIDLFQVNFTPYMYMKTIQQFPIVYHRTGEI